MDHEIYKIAFETNECSFSDHIYKFTSCFRSVSGFLSWYHCLNVDEIQATFDSRTENYQEIKNAEIWKIMTSRH